MYVTMDLIKLDIICEHNCLGLLMLLFEIRSSDLYIRNLQDTYFQNYNYD